MTDIFGDFINKKKAESGFLSLADGETAIVKRLKDIKLVTKAGYGGEEKEVLRLICEVETSEGTREKIFDNGTQKFAQELKDKGVKPGCGFTITRTGQQTKTRYAVTNVNDGITIASIPAVAPIAK